MKEGEEDDPGRTNFYQLEFKQFKRDYYISKMGYKQVPTYDFKHICVYYLFNAFTSNCDKGRDIYYAKYYGKGGGKWPDGEKMKLGVREKK